MNSFLHSKNNETPLSKNSMVILAVIIFITIITYLPSLNNGFTNWDDHAHVLKNPLVRSIELSNIAKILVDTSTNGYVGLTILSFAIDYHLFGPDAFYFHLLNLIYHCIVVGLLFYFLRQCGLSDIAAGFGSILFAIHPMHVESVAWVTSRKDVLYSIFYLSGMIFYIRYIKETRMKGWYYLTVLCGLFSIMAKIMAISFPLILFVLDRYFNRPITKKTIAEKIPHLSIALGIGLFTITRHIHDINEGFFEGILIWIWTYSFYLWKFLIPIDLLPLYMMPKPISLSNPVYFSAVAIMICSVTLFFKFRKYRIFEFSFLLYFISIFFVLKTNNNMVSIVADRYMYLPSIGYCIMFGLLCEKLIKYSQRNNQWLKWSACGAPVLLITLLCFLSSFQCLIWKDSLILWKHVLDKLPSNHVAYNNRAGEYLAREEYELALKDLNQALRLKSDSISSLNARGKAFYYLKQYRSALMDFNKLLRLDPEYFDGYNNRGAIALLQKKYDMALKDFNKVLEIKPKFVGGHLNKGKLYHELKRYDLAIESFTKAIEFNAYSSISYSHRANSYLSANEKDKAALDFAKAIELDPNYSDALISRGVMYFNDQQFDLALKDWNDAILIDPSSATAYINRANVYQQRGQYDSALKDYTVALSIQPDYVAGYNNRGALYRRNKQYDLALKDFDQSLKIDSNEAVAYANRSLTHQAMGKLQEAVNDAKRATELGYVFTENYIDKLLSKISGMNKL